MANSISYFMSITAGIMVVMFIVNMSMSNVASSEGFSSSFNLNDELNPMNSYDSGNYTLTNNVLGSLPSSANHTSISGDTGGYWYDLFGTFADWVGDLPGVHLILSIVNTLPNLLKLLFVGDLQPLAFAFGYMWFALFVFAIINWLKGGFG